MIEDDEQTEGAKYDVKIISRHNKNGIEVRPWSVNTIFKDVSVMKEQLVAQFHDVILDDELVFGYLLPGHGSKGRQQPIIKSSDLVMMYEAYKKRKKIILWLKVTRKKQKHLIDLDSQQKSKRPYIDEGQIPGPAVVAGKNSSMQKQPKQLFTNKAKAPVGGGRSNHDIHAQKMSEIQVIFEKLEDTHSEGQ